MSSLLKKALKDFTIEEDSALDDDSDVEKKPSLTKSTKIMTANDTNKYGFVKKRKKELHRQQKKRELASKQTQLKGNSEGLLNKHRKHDHLQENLAAVKRLSASLPPSLHKQADRALHRHQTRVQRREGGGPVKGGAAGGSTLPAPRRSIFSEKDFREFEGELRDLFTTR